ncbi:MAG: cytochrome P450 [Caulobacterales bacterium]
MALFPENTKMVEPPPHVPKNLVYDFDVEKDARILKDPHEAYTALHRDAPDIFFTRTGGGHWLVTRFDDVTSIMMNPQVFSNRRTLEPADNDTEYTLPPQDMDAPLHMKYRLLLMKFLAPKAVKDMNPRIRQLSVDLIEKLKGRNSCEFIAELAVPLPVQMFMSIMDLDTSQYKKYADWIHTIMGGGERTPEARMGAMMAVDADIERLVQERMEKPGTDAVSILLASSVDDKPLTVKRVKEMCYLLFLAGLDTVTCAMSFILRYMATHHDIQDRLRAHPEQISGAVEEFMRRIAFVNVPRLVTQDIVVNGVQMKRGDTVICSLLAASNDPRKIDHPMEVDLDRASSPHVAFNTGPHSCAGVHLARMELVIFLEEWLKRMPNVSLKPGFTPRFRAGSTIAMDELDLVW